MIQSTALFARTVSAAIYSMVKSYIIAFMAITLVIIVLIKDMKTGLFSMAPNLIPIMITMGSMGFMHVPLDLNSLLIGSPILLIGKETNRLLLLHGDLGINFCLHPIRPKHALHKTPRIYGQAQ